MHTGAMFASKNINAPSHDRASVALADIDWWRVCVIILSFFVVAATLSAVRKDVTRGFDEVAHTSYVAHLQRSGETWPAFEDMRMLDPSRFRFTSEPNYLNHPPPYYLLLARLGPDLEGHPEAIIVYRLFNVALGAIGLAALMAIGLVARLPRLTFYAYIVPLACIPALAPLAGAISNDNAAVAGGGIATLAAFQLLATGSRAWLAEFVREWMPTLQPRNALNYATLAIPITAVLCALAGILLAVRRIAAGKASPLDIVITSGAVAFAGTFILHGIFSYQLHAEFGWLTSAYPRYYLPLAAVVPLAGLTLLGAIEQPSVRAVLLVFLIAGPVIFRLLGAPLG